MSPEERCQQAKANGYEPGSYRDKDAVHQTRQKSGDTSYRHRRAIELWREWREQVYNDTSNFYLRPETPNPPPTIVKDFLRYFLAVSPGRLAQEKNQVTVNHFYTAFCNGLEAVTAQTLVEEDTRETLLGKIFSRKEKEEIRHWIVNVLIKDEKKVTTRVYEKNKLGVSDLVNLIATLWGKDGLRLEADRWRSEAASAKDGHCEAVRELREAQEQRETLRKENKQFVKRLRRLTLATSLLRDKCRQADEGVLEILNVMEKVRRESCQIRPAPTLGS